MQAILTPFKLAIVSLLLTMSVHAHASILLTAGPNEGAGPQTWEHAEVRLNSSGQVLSRISAVYRADRYGLRAEADVINDQWPPHPAPYAGIRVDDVVVNAATVGRTRRWNSEYGMRIDS